jgi:hypothetical protein
LALTWVALRFNERLGITLSLLNGLFGKLATLFFLFWIAGRIAERGGAWIAPGVLLGLVGLVSPGVPAAATAHTLWQVLSEGLPED